MKNRKRVKKMKKINKKGFTLIELLAVIVIMGILMMVAIPSMTRYIENSRKDTFLNTAKEYASATSNMWSSDSFSCNGVNSSSVDAGSYYISVGLANSTELLEKGGKSPWGNQAITGYIKITVQANSTGRLTTKYFVNLADSKGHGINDDKIEATNLVRGNVKTTAAIQATIPTGSITCVEQ